MNDEGKNFFRYLAVALVVIVLGLAAYHWGLPAYRHFKEKRYATEAQAFFERGDYRNALLSARLTLVLNSNNLPACRLMAELHEAGHSPATLDWWRHVAELSPTADNKLILADAGLRYQSPPYPLTSELLNELSPTAAGLPQFHVVSAELALALRHIAEAQSHFEAACRLDPTNRFYQLNLAVIRLGNTNPAAAAEARATLNQFCTDTNLGPVALRSLASDRLAHDDVTGALGYSTQLPAGAQAILSDRLQQLGILKRLHSADLTGQLQALQQQSATNAAQTAQVAEWMAANGLRTEAIGWMNHLPANIQTQLPVRITLADCYLEGEDWKSLRDFASKGSWGETEFLRLAYLSRAWSKLGESMVASGEWSSAVNLANNQFGALNALLELAGRWSLPSEQEDLLWRILRRFPDAAWAQQNLQRLYFASGDTKHLYQLFSERFPHSPQNLDLKNDLAFTALLLKTNLNQACEWAAETYACRTNYPSVVSTYAYALHLQHRDRDGLALLRQLDQTNLEQPSIALYYGVLLAAAGNGDEAAPFLAIAKAKGQFLPEEKQLLTETEASR